MSLCQLIDNWTLGRETAFDSFIYNGTKRTIHALARLEPIGPAATEPSFVVLLLNLPPPFSPIHLQQKAGMG